MPIDSFPSSNFEKIILKSKICYGDTPVIENISFVETHCRFFIRCVRTLPRVGTYWVVQCTSLTTKEFPEVPFWPMQLSPDS